MIRILLILLLSSACILNAFAKFDLETTNGEPLELLKLRTKALVEGPYAEVQYIQTYRNPLDHTVETEFNFPRTESSIFHKFEAVFQNQTIVGRVLEKETAKKMYDWNTKRGNTVAYSERNQVAPDVMNIKVGNIPANETVEIIFSVIQPLDTIINKFYELRLPVGLTERNNPYSVDPKKIPNIQTVDSNNSLYKEWNIQVEIKSNTPFAILNNPTHNLTPELSEKPSGTISKIYKAVWNATVIPNKDFVVYFGPEKLEKPETILATYPQKPDNHVLLVNFIPDLTIIQPQVAQDLLDTSSYDGLLKLKRMAYEYDIEHAQAEFIFVIDRSGSMMGSRIENLKRALIKFLNTIPKASYFNIISFGTYAERYKPQSILNSPQVLEEAIEWIETIQADMGGTEILDALKYLAKSGRPEADFPRIVMTLTDGDVFNPGQVIDYITENAKKARFCSVGIGSGASDYLVRNMARAGKCQSEFVLDHEDIGDKALYLVQAAVSQYLTDIRFDINCLNDKNERVYSDKVELDLLMKDQAFSKWIYLENIPNLKSCQATLGYYNSLKGNRVTEEMNIQAYEIEEITNFWHKIAYDAKIKELEEGIKIGRTWYKGENADSYIVKLSTKYQILSDYTSFLAILQESTVNPNEAAQRINIPNLKSVDYSSSQREFEQNSGSKEGVNYADNHRQAVNYLHSIADERKVYHTTRPGSGVDIPLGLDCNSVTEVALDVELEYIFDPDLFSNTEVDVDVEIDVNVYPAKGDEEDSVVDEYSYKESKTQNLDITQADWNCENADDIGTKECSQVENFKKQEEAQIEDEMSIHKLAESSDLKLMNITNHTNHTNLTELVSQANETSQQLTENSIQFVQIPTPALIQIFDEKELEGLQKSEDKSSKTNLGLTGLIFLLLVFLF